MKLLLIVADAGRLDQIRDDLNELRAPGYSAVPVIEGAGRTGVHTGDRIHPGGLVSLFVVAPDEEASYLFDEIVRRRDDAEDRITRLFLLPVEKQA